MSCSCRGCDNKMDGNQPLLETSLKSGPEAFLHTDQREGNEYHADKRPDSVCRGRYSCTCADNHRGNQ